MPRFKAWFCHLLPGDPVADDLTTLASVSPSVKWDQ